MVTQVVEEINKIVLKPDRNWTKRNINSVTERWTLGTHYSVMNTNKLITLRLAIPGLLV